MSSPDQNPADVLEFFERTIPDQIHLTAIDPEKRMGVVARDFGADPAVAQAWALQQNTAGLNVYYTVNRVRDGLHGKPSKSDIVGVRFAHVDVDPPKGAATFTEEERAAAYARLLAASPGVLVWSGNGFQGLWRLAEGVGHDEVEEINRGLIDALGGDTGTHDVSRLLRVAGTINWPDERKRSIGRVPAPSKIVLEDYCIVNDAAQLLADYPVTEQLRDRADGQPRSAVALADINLLTADDLNLPGDAYLRRVIEEPEGLDRSDDVFHFACEALRQGLTQQQVEGVLLNSANAISEHCLSQADPARAARRAIERALGEPDVHVLARKHERERERDLAAAEGPTDETKVWLLGDMLSDCVLIEEGSQVADTTRPGHVLSQADFKVSTAASTFLAQVPARGGGERTIRKKVADAWLADPARRTVATQTFRAGAAAVTSAPDGRTALNTWRGLRATTPPADWDLRAQPFIDHVEWLFGAESALFLDWAAHAVQRPGELPSIAFLHIAPRTGMGRNLISSVLGRIFVGYAALSFPLGLTLRTGYNGLLAGKLLAVVDEIDEGDGGRRYQMQQDLKQLVTEETRTINPKYARQHVEWNACRWLIFSNSEAAIPLEDADRRFVVVRCDDGPRHDAYYWELYRLRDDLAFIASVAAYLANRDIAHFRHGMRAPTTAAKAGLLARVRSDSEQAAFDIAERWPVDVITSEEIDTVMGEERHRGSAKRYTLDRAGLIRLGTWKEQAYGTYRKKVTAYAVRNSAAWKGADVTALRAEITRVDDAGKDKALYGDAPKAAAAGGC
jgi:hypothetical protein